MLRTDSDLVLLGDFNICLLKNKNKNNSKLHREYKQLLTFFGCKQIIDKPTRITEPGLGFFREETISSRTPGKKWNKLFLSSFVRFLPE